MGVENRTWVTWNTVFGVVGRVLIASGLLLFGFVAYQLWGTGLHTARAQDRLAAQFADLLDSDAPPTGPAPTTAPPATPATTTPAITTPATTTPAITTPAAVTPAAITPATMTPAADQPVTVRLGGPLARIEVPTAGIDHIVVAGVRVTDLRDGPGHFPETPLPGQAGNAAIAGHRTTYGQPFIDIDRAAVGDEVIITTPWGRFVYVVNALSIVPPEAYGEVIPTTDASRATLTLVTCHPKYSSRERLIVHAEFDPTRSDPLVDATPVTWATDEPAPGVGDPFAPTGSQAPSTTGLDITTPGTGSETSAPAAEASTSTSTTIVVDSSDDDAAPAGVDAFSDRWFSDPDAFAPVGLWGLLLAVIAVAATLLSRWRRSNWWGLLVGTGPFLVVLYVWFGQVARLLPPNL